MPSTRHQTQPSRSPDGPLDIEAANRLVSDHLYLVQHLVNQLSTRYPRHVDRQELWNAGAAGLVEASRRYDPATGVPFGGYASIRIRGAIIDSTRTHDLASRGVRRSMRETNRAVEAFEATHGRPATNAELASELGISVDELDSRRAAVTATTLLHLDQQIGGDGPTTLGELIADDEDRRSPEEALEERELLGTLRAALPFLPEPQASVVRRHYFDGELLRDIASSMGVTEARVSQIRSEALNALREYFGSAYEGTPRVEVSAPGVRRRAAFSAAVSEHTTWRTRLEAADDGRAAHGLQAYWEAAAR